MTKTETAAPRERDGLGAGLRYRPYLDGLRCVAVYLVVAFHAALGGFAGGFVGVDVFFVLSGYLVTRILLRDLVQRDRIDFRRFYSRRFRRILPAAATMLVLTALGYAIVATPLEVANVAGGFRAAFLYFANWHFIQQSTNYFAPSVNASPVLHFWSLAVEEQFYLTWPLVLGGLFVATRRAGRRRWWALRLTVAAVAIVSVVDAFHYGAAGLDRAYYGTDTRAYQLLAGALIALTPQLVSSAHDLAAVARRTAPIALVVFVLLASSLFDMSPITRGGWVVVATVVLIVALERSAAGVIARSLSDRRVAYLGRISYGTYLWHWPVIVILTHNSQINPTALFVITVIVATALAALSFHVIEHPIRAASFLDSRNMAVIAVALCISLTAGLVISPALEAVAGSGTSLADLSISVPTIHTGASRLLDWRRAQNDGPSPPECLHRPIAVCTVVRGTGQRVLLMGDSLAAMWLPAFVQIAKQDSMTLVIASHPSCPWLRNLGGLDISVVCPRYRADWFDRIVPGFDPNIVFLADRAYDAPGNPLALDIRGHLVPARSALGETRMAEAEKASLAVLRQRGRKLVILEPTPLPSDPTFDPLSCVSGGSTHCAFRVSTIPTALVRYDRLLARQPDVWSLDVDQLACPHFPECDPVVNDVIVRRDHVHMTGTYVLTLADSLDALLRAEHIL